MDEQQIKKEKIKALHQAYKEFERAMIDLEKEQDELLKEVLARIDKEKIQLIMKELQDKHTL